MRTTAPDLSLGRAATAQEAPARATAGLLHVVAGAICNPQGEVLIARRPEHTHQGGLWEFPGGKCEAGESAEEALSRELEEELGIQVRRAERLIQVPYRYADKGIWLDVWRVTAFDGEPHGREGQPVRWQPLARLAEVAFPAANYPIVSALQLPDTCLVTGVAENNEQFLARLRSAFEAGIRLVQLRAHELPSAAYARLAADALAMARSFGARVLLNCAPEEAARLQADGVHLTRWRLKTWEGRSAADAGRLISASCHDLAELRMAEAKGVDLVFLSPVLPTASHPGAATLGWAGFALLVAETRLPVFGLGGLSGQHLPQLKAAGAQGVASIRAFWS